MSCRWIAPRLEKRDGSWPLATHRRGGDRRRRLGSVGTVCAVSVKELRLRCLCVCGVLPRPPLSPAATVPSRTRIGSRHTDSQEQEYFTECNSNLPENEIINNDARWQSATM